MPFNPRALRTRLEQFAPVLVKLQVGYAARNGGKFFQAVQIHSALPDGEVKTPPDRKSVQLSDQPTRLSDMELDPDGVLDVPEKVRLASELAATEVTLQIDTIENPRGITPQFDYRVTHRASVGGTIKRLTYLASELDGGDLPPEIDWEDEQR